MQALEGELTPTLDWRGVIRAANLTRFEARLFIAHWRREVPRYRLHIVLDCRLADAARAYLCVLEKLRLGGSVIAGQCMTLEPLRDSTRPAYRERLHTGARPWSLSALDLDFASIMSHEKYFGLLSPRHPSEMSKARRVCPLTNREANSMEAKHAELQGKLAAAKVRLRELGATRDEFRIVGRDVQAALWTSEAEERAEREQALIDKRPIQKHLVRAPELKAKLAAAQENLATAEGAVARQSEAVTVIERQIAEGKNEAFRAATAELRARIRAKISDLADDMAAFQEIGFEFGQSSHGLAGALFPTDPTDPLAGYSYIMAALDVGNAALMVHAFNGMEPTVLRLAKNAA